MAQSCDANTNVKGRAHTNQSRNTRIYHVEFTGGEVTESTTNVIAE